MIVDIVDKYCTNDNNPIKKPTLEKLMPPARTIAVDPCYCMSDY